MSEREREKRKMPEFEKDMLQYKRWTDEDKEKLLDALQKYGHKNVDKIAEELPDKTVGSIRTMINKLNRKAKEATKTNDSKVHQWLKSGKLGQPDLIISQAFKFISMFEDIPKPEECAGCDFKSLYSALSQATIGQPKKDISKMSQETLNYVMSQAAHEIWPFYEDEMKEYINSVEDRKVEKTYTRKGHLALTTMKKEKDIKNEIIIDEDSL